jgi:hypothetical protein
MRPEFWTSRLRSCVHACTRARGRHATRVDAADIRINVRSSLCAHIRASLRARTDTLRAGIAGNRDAQPGRGR